MKLKVKNLMKSYAGKKVVKDISFEVNQGEIVADDSAANLQRKTSKKQVVRVEFDKEISRNKLQSIKGVSVVKNYLIIYFC